jgi:hypothetical protein
MKIKRFNEINENVDADIFGIQRTPSFVGSRRNQTFKDYHTKQRFTGKSKYELSREIWRLAQREDEVGILAQYLLQLERESIESDDQIISNISDIERDVVSHNVTKVEQ